MQCPQRTYHQKLRILYFSSLTDFFVILFMQRFTQGLSAHSFQQCLGHDAVRQGEGGEFVIVFNDEELYIPPARTTRTDCIHSQTSHVHIWAMLAGESADFCFTCSKEEFDRKVKKHLLASNVVIYNRLLQFPSCKIKEKIL
jgi:hypothetical protein